MSAVWTGLCGNLEAIPTVAFDFHALDPRLQAFNLRSNLMHLKSTTFIALIAPLILQKVAHLAHHSAPTSDLSE